jgi:cell division protease FtsH
LRGAGLGGGHDEREQTLNQLLVEMDGFETNEGVIIIAATNRPDVLDPALLRPGRFDRQVVVDLPDIRGREKILAVHTKKIPLSREVDLKVISRGTPGFTGADLANLVNEAALLAARQNRKRVSMQDMEDAKDKVLMGPERRSMIISDSEKEVIAYHESGHAIIGIMTGSDPVHKVTIIPRGRALGLTMQLPAEEKHIHSKKHWMNQIQRLFGGRLAEEIKFGEISTGSGNDIARASDIARKMVTEWGMSDKLGPLTFGQKNEQIFLGREISQHRDFSEATAQIIDEEVNGIIKYCLEEARKILVTNMDKFETLAKNLIERETLDASEIKMLMAGETLPPITNGKSSKPAVKEEPQMNFEA